MTTSETLPEHLLETLDNAHDAASELAIFAGNLNDLLASNIGHKSVWAASRSEVALYQKVEDLFSSAQAALTAANDAARAASKAFSQKKV